MDVVGITVMALGTSSPELMANAAGALRGESELTRGIANKRTVAAFASALGWVTGNISMPGICSVYHHRVLSSQSANGWENGICLYCFLSRLYIAESPTDVNITAADIKLNHRP